VPGFVRYRNDRPVQHCGLGYYDSIQKLETAQDALGADASFAQLLDAEASQTYLTSSTLQTFARRVV
jgi:hypothetical protein